MVLTSFVEMLSIGAILPFLGVITAPDYVFKHELARPLIALLDIKTPSELVLPLTAGFCFGALVSGAMRLLLIYASNRYSFGTGADIGLNIYRRTLYQPYAVHVARNSVEVIDGVANKSNIITFSVLAPGLQLLSAVLTGGLILAGLVAIDPAVALVAFAGFGSVYLSITLLTRRQLRTYSQMSALKSTKVLKALNEGLGAIRDVLLHGSQSYYLQTYRNSDLPLRKALGYHTFVSSSPRPVVESLAMVLIATMAYVLSTRAGGVGVAIPILGTIALGAQRLLPVLQLAFASFSNINSARSSLRDVIELLDQPLPEYVIGPSPDPIRFREKVSMSNISFRYAPDSSWVLNGVSLDIQKGSRVGFVGATGSGKSTLIDIFMGLLRPSSGLLKVDGVDLTDSNLRAWQRHIAHVPQTIYLSDGTIEENIAFGIADADIDRSKVRRAAEMAQLAEFIETLPRKYSETVGDRGVRLSGGQRQRIGIARSLYREADILVFDEATSALDTETESSLIAAIESLEKSLTIIMIAHRLSTLKGCDQIIELSRGEVVRVGTYNSLFRVESEVLLPQQRVN